MKTTSIMIPCPIFIAKCISINCCLTGSCHSSQVSHEKISFGSGTILKWCEIWEEQWEWRIGLVHCLFCCCPRRGYWWCCCWSHKNTGYIIWFHSTGSGLHGGGPLQVKSWLGLGPLFPWWNLTFAAILLTMCCWPLRVCSHFLWVNLQWYQSTKLLLHLDTWRGWLMRKTWSCSGDRHAMQSLHGNTLPNRLDINPTCRHEWAVKRL